MEDIHFLREYGVEESFLFVVSSSSRDKTVHPEPNEYQVHFNSPFINVVGLDLIDATVPRTEYLVETPHNSLVYMLGGTEHTLHIPPGDYNILQLVAALNERLPQSIRVSTDTVPAEVSNKVTFVADQPFALSVAKSGLSKALGLGAHGTLDAGTPVSGAFGSVNVVDGPLPTTGTCNAHDPVRQTFEAPATGHVHDIMVYVSSVDQQDLRWAVFEDSGLLGTGVTKTSGTSFERITVTASGALVKGRTYHVAFQGEVDVYSDGSVPAHTNASQGEWWLSSRSAVLCVTATMKIDGFVIRPPWLVDLTGEPYILIRCPEIERELFRDRANEPVHAGLGLVKLANYGFREQRYDFSSFPPRRLPTPYGKLGKLTIRLEKGNGELYDTKGVDHFLVMVIKYLEIVRGPGPMPSVQNPHYQPDPLKFIAQSYNPARAH